METKTFKSLYGEIISGEYGKPDLLTILPGGGHWFSKAVVGQPRLLFLSYAGSEIGFTPLSNQAWGFFP